MKAINLDKVTTPVEGSESDEGGRPRVGKSRPENNSWLKEGSRTRVSRSRPEDNSWLKEVLRRENQGLKVHPVDGSSVFSMTGTYF